MQLQEQQAVSVISALPATKKELTDYCEIIKSAVLNGDQDIIDIAKKVNMMGRVVDFFEKDNEIQRALLSEAEKYGKGERSDIQVREVGVKYDFASCGHSEYNRLKKEAEKINAKLKSIEAMLKLSDCSGVDTETGEEYNATKAVKSSTTKVVLTIK